MAPGENEFDTPVVNKYLFLPVLIVGSFTEEPYGQAPVCSVTEWQNKNFHFPTKSVVLSYKITGL